MKPPSMNKDHVRAKVIHDVKVVTENHGNLIKRVYGVSVDRRRQVRCDLVAA